MSAKEKIIVLKGDFFARLRGTTGPFKPMFNATAAQIAMSITTIKQKSNGNTPGTLAEDETDREAKFDVTLQSQHTENLEKFTYANSIERIAGTAVAVTLPIGEVGDMVNCGVSNVTSTTFGSKVAGVDYELFAANGTIKYMTAFTASVTGTVDHDAYTELGLLSADSQEYEILFVAKASKKTYDLYRVRLSPAAALQLISDNYGACQLTGTLLVDPNMPSDGVLGQYGRLRSVA